MKKEIAKKTIILYVLKMLQEVSSEDMPITNTHMANTLNAMDIPCDRKTIGRNVQYLIDFGYDIVKVPKKGYYMKKNKD